MKLSFCMEINITLSYKLIPSILLGMAIYAQKIKNKFAKFLQYLKKEVSDEVEFFLQINIKVFCKFVLLYFW